MEFLRFINKLNTQEYMIKLKDNDGDGKWYEKGDDVK